MKKLSLFLVLTMLISLLSVGFFSTQAAGNIAADAVMVTEGQKLVTANGVTASFTEMHWGGRVSYSEKVSLKDFSITLKDVKLTNASQYYGGLMFGFYKANGAWVGATAGEGLFFKLIREGNAALDTWQSYAVAGGTDLIAMTKYDVFNPVHMGTNVDYSTINFWVKQGADGNWSFGINDFTGTFTDEALKAVFSADVDDLYFAVGIPTSAPIDTRFTVSAINGTPVETGSDVLPDVNDTPGSGEDDTGNGGNEDVPPAVPDVPAVDVNQSAYESLALHVLETGDLLDTIANPEMTTIDAKTDNGIPVTFRSHWGCRALYTPEMIPVDGLRVVLKDVQFSAPGDGSGIMFSLNKAGVWIGAEEKQGLFFRVRNVLATVDGQEVVKSYFGVMGSPGMYSNTYIGDEVMLGTNLDLSTLVFTFIRNADGSWTAAINGKGVTFSHEALTAAFDGDFIKTSLEFGQNSSYEVTTKFSVYSVEQLKQLFDYSGADDKSLPAPPALTETKAPYYVQDGDVVNYWNVPGASVGDWTENGVLCVVDQMHWGARFLFADSFTTFHGLKIVLKDLELDHNSPGAGWMFGFEDTIGSYLTDAGFYVRIMANEKNGTNYPTIDVSTVGAVNVGKFGDIFPTTPLTYKLLEEYLEIHFTVSEDGSTLHMYVNGDTFDVPTEPLARWMDAECWFEFSPSYSGFVSQKACLYEVSNMFDEPEEDNGDEGDDEIILPGLDGDNENEKPSDDNKPSEDDEDEKPSDEKPGTSPGTGVASFAGVALLAAAVSAGAAFTTRKRRK